MRLLGSYMDLGGEGFEGAYGFALAGKYVAYDDALCDHSTCDGALKVVDISTGRIFRRAEIKPGEGWLGGVVIKPNGSIAWMREHVIYKLDSAGQRLLDSGEAIYDLALSGSRVYWTKYSGPNSGSPKTAMIK